MLQGEYYDHRPHFTGRPSGLGVMGSCKVYQPLFTGPLWQKSNKSKVTTVTKVTTQIRYYY